MPHDTSKISFQTDYVRRSIICSYWLIILSALPLWWHTTNIERLSLPSSRVISQSHQNLHIPIKVGIEVGSEMPSSVTQLHTSLTGQIGKTPDRWEGLDIEIYDTVNTKWEEADNSYAVINGENMDVQGRRLTFPTRYTASISELSETLGALIAPLTFTSEQHHRVVQYSPQYRLSFTLLHEDASTGKYFSSWDVEGALSRHITPILSQLTVLHNFTIESQVQFHAPLAFSPLSFYKGFGITSEDLTVFVNSAEWTLSSSASNDPILHFIIFVPSAAHGPLFILDNSDQVSPSTSFLLPQWGGIVILNTESFHQPRLSSPRLDFIFSIFSSHLLILLGVPSLPLNVENLTKHQHVLTDWQLDALLRYRALGNARGSKETLQSIVTLAEQIKGMPIRQDVRGDIQDALTAFEKVLEVSTISLTEIFRLSTHSLTLASRAFFNPGMLALLYFPAEHKYTIYVPLFAIAGIPLVVATLKELSTWRRQRRVAVLNTARVEDTS